MQSDNCIIKRMVYTMGKQRLQLTWYNKDKALIPTENGKYGYKWVDPDDPRYCETHTLILDEYIRGVQTPKSDNYEYSKRADLIPQDDNLLILGESGDVLETLTRVPELANKYVGQVKLIYIDPPFNTEQTFASYEDNLEHSIWLTMMRDRLLHLKKLLSKDGSIWVHLDDAENHRMRLLLDEIFEAKNFITEIIWQKADSPRNDALYFSSDHDVILVYSKGEEFSVNRLPRTAADNARFSNPDNDPNGAWWDDNPVASGGKSHQGMVFAIQQPITGELIYPAANNHWRFGQQRLLEIMNEWAPYKLQVIDDEQKRAALCGISVEEVRKDVPAIILDVPIDEARKHAKEVYNRGKWPTYILRSGGTGGLGRKSYIPTRLNVPRTMWENNEVGHNRTAKAEIKALFPGETPFSTPKPERLLERIIHIATNPGDIVLDCFAGSGTTAAVAQKMGRKWVTCELLESTFNNYTKPRLEKIVNDQDAGGITRTKGERIVADGVDLPEGVDADDAATFTKILNKLIADNDELKKDKIIKQLKKMTKTKRMREVINWRGGGGFQVAHLSPACFDYDSEIDRVFLTDDANGDILVRSVAANLGFTMLDKNVPSVFDARRGKTVLKVIDGVASNVIVDWLVSHVQLDETIVLAVTSVEDGVREYLRRCCKGSRIVNIPDDIFDYSKGGED